MSLKELHNVHKLQLFNNFLEQLPLKVPEDIDWFFFYETLGRILPS